MILTETIKAITRKINNLTSPRESVNQFRSLFNTDQAITILTGYNAPAIVNQLDTVQSVITSIKGSYDKVYDQR